LIKDFNFTEFFGNKKIINQEIKGKGVNYPIEIDSVEGPTELQIKIIIPACPEKNQLIPITELIIQENTSIDTAEEIILDGDDLVLIFTAGAGVYYIPVTVKNISLLEKGDKETVIAGQAVLAGKVLSVERQRCERINLNQPVTYFLSSLKYKGLIKDISPVGVRLVANQQIKGDKLILDFSFAEAGVDRVPGEIIWRKKLLDGDYLYGVNFKFVEPAQQAQLEKWLTKLA